MRIIEPAYKFENLPYFDESERLIERAARTCYKSEDKIGAGSASRLIRQCISRGHLSVLEHVNITVRIICDRGVSHEVVRHRLASFSQESTRFANYSGDRFGNEITVIRPFFFEPDSPQYMTWIEACEKCENAYLEILKHGGTPQQARSVLPNSLKTEVVITANVREWRHILQLRCDAAAHPQMRQIMIPILSRLQRWSKSLFGDIDPGSWWRFIHPAGEIYSGGLLEHEWDASREVSEFWAGE